MQTQNNDVAIRLACRPGTKVTWPDKFTMQLGHELGSVRAVTMQKTECADCKGKGTVQLFLSDSECDKCLGCGYYAEGRDWGDS